VAKTSVAKKPTSGGKKSSSAPAAKARHTPPTRARNGKHEPVARATKLAPSKLAPSKLAPSKLAPSKLAPSMKSTVMKAPANAVKSHAVKSPLVKSASTKPAVLKAAASAAPLKRPAAVNPPPTVKRPAPDLVRTKTKLDKPSKNHQPIAPVVVAEPPRADGKPRKNQAGLSTKELAHFRDLLLAKRRELVGDMSSMEREALRSATSNLSNLPLHMADQGTDNYEQEFTLGLVEKDRQLLREINRALGKIVDGTYGLCEGTGKPINKARLEFQPWAKYSIEYARQLEKGLGMMMRR
jgi:DnaK suppressor protein